MLIHLAEDVIQSDTGRLTTITAWMTSSPHNNNTQQTPQEAAENALQRSQVDAGHSTSEMRDHRCIPGDPIGPPEQAESCDLLPTLLSSKQTTGARWRMGRGAPGWGTSRGAVSKTAQ